jgi:hypothetical protein
METQDNHNIRKYGLDFIVTGISGTIVSDHKI